MAKTRQILKVSENGMSFSVTKTEDECNPYRVYRHTWEMGRYGYYTDHKRLVAKYADMYSVMTLLREYLC